MQQQPQPQDSLEKARKLESQGWHVWLKTLFPFAFDEEFSDDHRKYWDLRWSVLHRIREQQKCLALGSPIPPQHLIRPDEYVTLLVLGRGLAKSSSLEASSVMRGALLGGGYCLYVSEAQDQSEEHVGNCKILINHEESKLLDYYPDMAIVEGAVVGGIKTKDRADIFTTRNGWICRAKGLNSRLRGLRIGNRRPDDIKLDDIDGVNDSVAVSLKKLRQLTASVIPTQARRFTTLDFGQNLIIETGTMNQICTGRTDALGQRTTIGVTNTFSHFDYESYIDEGDGRLKHRILPSSIPTWKGVDIAQAQKFLDDAGLYTFLAEYQNDFEQTKEGRVLRNYDDALMVITESDFAKVFGSIGALDSFNKYPGHDWSRTKTEYHANVAGTLAVSSQNTPLPGRLFLHDLLSFNAGTHADDVGLRILETISPFVPDLAATKRTEKLTFSRQTWRQLIDASFSRDKLDNFITGTTQLIDARRNILAGVIPKFTSVLLEKRKYKRFVGSHDQNNDALELYRRVYGLPFHPVNPGETGGLEWADHYMTVDKTSRHPFFEDELLEDGTWKLGCPGFFIIVKDNKRAYPQSVTSEALHGSDLCRFQFNNWRMRPQKVTDAGAIEHGPMKMHDDYGQMLQMILCGNQIATAVLNYYEKLEVAEPQLMVLNQKIKETKTLTPQEQMAYHVLQGMAKKKMAGSGVRRFDESGELIKEY
jgi:hypothetical protein